MAGNQNQTPIDYDKIAELQSFKQLSKRKINFYGLLQLFS